MPPNLTSHHHRYPILKPESLFARHGALHADYRPSFARFQGKWIHPMQLYGRLLWALMLYDQDSDRLIDTSDNNLPFKVSISRPWEGKNVHTAYSNVAGAKDFCPHQAVNHVSTYTCIMLLPFVGSIRYHMINQRPRSSKRCSIRNHMLKPASKTNPIHVPQVKNHIRWSFSLHHTPSVL